MTVTYTAQVATSSFSCFLKLLVRWRGSIYKLLWKDFILFAFLYYLLSFVYRFVLDDYQKEIFEMIVKYCGVRNTLIPVAFILGFYVSLVMTRYWSQLGHIPWPDHMAMYVTANVHGLDERGRLMRRTMLRYINLAYAMTMSSISQSVKKRFPTLAYLVQAGLLTSNELQILEHIQTPHNKFFIPLAWTTSLVNRARKEGRIKDDFAVKTLIDEVNNFRMHLATLFVYDMISMPLVYTQVVTIAVYTFFVACLMGRQFVRNDTELPDVYFPLFTFLEYLFYMGWLKVAECFVNPFGEDEDDFDMNYLIDRNLQVSYLLVDEIHDEHPELIRDQYWDDVNFSMPYTSAAEEFRLKSMSSMRGSAVDLTLSAKEKEIIPMETVGELDEVCDGAPPMASTVPITRPGSSSRLQAGSYRARFSRSSSNKGPESPVTHSFPLATFTVGSMDTVNLPITPTSADVNKNIKVPSTPNSPLSPLSEETQFLMDAESYDNLETDPLVDKSKTPTSELDSGSLSADAMPLKAVLSRISSKSPTSVENSESAVEQSADEPSENGNKSPSTKPPRITLVIQSTDTADDVDLTAGGRHSGESSSLRQRIVASPTLSPDIPPSPELTSPLWVQGPHQPSFK